MNSKAKNSRKLIGAGCKVVLLFLCCLIKLDAIACAGAAQNRIFPLGSCPQGIVVVEVHLWRGEVFDEEQDELLDVVWDGTSYLKIYDKNYQTVSSELIDSLKAFPAFSKHEYNSAVGKTFAKGMESAQKLPDFIPAKPLSIWFCDYKKKCKKASLHLDTAENKLFVKLPNKKKYEVPFLEDKTAISAHVFTYYGFFSDDEEDCYDEEDCEPEREIPKGALYINSVRRFDLNGQKLTIVHLGVGDNLFNLPSKEYAAKFPFKDINHSVFEERVLHHGRGFDFFILE